MLNTALIVALCLLISCLLLLTMIVPEVMVWIVCTGVVVCCTVAGIRVDRQLRNRDRW